MSTPTTAVTAVQCRSHAMYDDVVGGCVCEYGWHEVGGSGVCEMVPSVSPTITAAPSTTASPSMTASMTAMSTPTTAVSVAQCGAHAMYDDVVGGCVCEDCLLYTSPSPRDS